ncbi:MAG: hypothetical protein GPJ50_08285 [Candidatus Heimdallarchaeota archaeon]|nr:hypothetical protein [Candidatus Heimdallarchaeota archaeon]
MISFNNLNEQTREVKTMRKLYDVTVVDKKTDEILVDTKVPAQDEVEAALQASSGKAIDRKKVDIVIRELGILSPEPETVVVERE